MASDRDRLRAELLSRIANRGYDITLTADGIEISEEVPHTD